MAVTEVSLMPILPRTQSADITPSLSVRRCLFGPVDHELVRRDFEREMKSMTESNTRRWNFDFEKECPLPGRYLWTQLNSTSERTTTCNSTESSSQDLRSSISQVSQELPSERTTCTVETTTKTASKTRSKRPSSHKITDFLRQQKTCPRSDRYSKCVRRQSRCKQTCLDKFLK